MNSRGARTVADQNVVWEYCNIGAWQLQFYVAVGSSDN
jgi:hypothetical protein